MTIKFHNPAFPLRTIAPTNAAQRYAEVIENCRHKRHQRLLSRARHALAARGQPLFIEVEASPERRSRTVRFLSRLRTVEESDPAIIGRFLIAF
jgi:hypothetical protein